MPVRPALRPADPRLGQEDLHRGGAPQEGRRAGGGLRRKGGQADGQRPFPRATGGTGDESKRDRSGWFRVWMMNRGNERDE